MSNWVMLNDMLKIIGLELQLRIIKVESEISYSNWEMSFVFQN